MEIQKLDDILIKEFNGIIPIRKELSEILKNEDLVFLHRDKNEVHVMKKVRYDAILEKLKKTQGYDDVLVYFYTKGGDKFNADFAAQVCSLSVSNHYMSLSGGGQLLKKLTGQDICVKILV